jgi:hypothetical protein
MCVIGIAWTLRGATPGDGGDANPPNDGDKIARLDQHRGYVCAQQMRLRLGTAFIEHVDNLWPEGEPAAKPE